MVLMLSQKRIFDLAAGAALLILFLPLLFLIALAVKLTSRGSVIHWSKRVGRDNRLFDMPKFRTMCTGTPQLASHLLLDSDRYLTPIGKILRNSSMDELPQLFSVLSGDLSLVGPRPALFNQDDLIEMRTEKGVHLLLPGITGWAQINGRDGVPISVKVRCDHEYLQRQSLAFDLKILAITAKAVAARRRVSH